MKTSLTISVSVFVLCTLVGCNDRRGADAVDAAAGNDMAASGDASVPRDTSVALDQSFAGDDAAADEDAQVELDADVGADSSPGADASAAIDSSVSTDASIAIDASTVDARTDAGASGFVYAPRTTPYETGEEALDALVDAVAAVTTKQCECDWELSGYESYEDCIAGETTTLLPQESACYATVYDASVSDARARYSCFASLTLQLGECLTEYSCDEASDSCYTDGTAGTYVAEVNTCDALADEDAESEFAATLYECIIGSGADTCSASATAVSTLGDAVFSGSTVGAGDHRKASMDCLGLDEVEDYALVRSADVAHRWQAPSSSEYTFDTYGTDFDTVLYVIVDGQCASATPTMLGCNDDDGEGDVASTLTIALTEGQTVQVIIDGYGVSDYGDYVINITEEP